MNTSQKILIVDDEINNLEFYGELLKSKNYQISTATNSEEALNILGKFNPDLVLLDIVLKNESGLDILKKIKSTNDYKYTMVVLISGQLITSDEQATGIELGADGYLTRPIKNREFIARIDAFMRHRNTLESLRKSENRFRLIIENNPDAIIIVDETGKIKFANKASEDLFKVSVDSLLKRLYGYPLVSGEKTEINIVRKDQKEVIGEMRTINIEWDDKNTFLASIRDITDKKQLINEIIEAKDKAERSDKLKTMFLENMSHEIRTPMNAIVGFIDLLTNENFSEEKQDKFLLAIKQGSNRLLNTINEIIEISQIESGALSVQEEDFYLVDVIQNLCDMFKSQMEKKGLFYKFSFDLDKEKSLINTDKNKLETILSNLISNAIKFTNNGYIEIGFTKNSEELDFFIKDTGRGIDKKSLETIFERFVQADYSLTSPYEGAGLGLSITKAYVNMLGGSISVTSEHDKGSTFVFNIVSNKINKSKTDKKTEEEKVQEFRNKRVLIVEDDTNSYLLLENFLTDLDNSVVIAKTGEEALKIIDVDKAFDLILMDIKLLGMNGLTATKEIKKVLPSIPIIAQTAYAFPFDKQKAIDAGCDDYISKPIKFNDLAKILSTYN